MNERHHDISIHSLRHDLSINTKISHKSKLKINRCLSNRYNAKGMLKVSGWFDKSLYDGFFMTSCLSFLFSLVINSCTTQMYKHEIIFKKELKILLVCLHSEISTPLYSYLPNLLNLFHVSMIFYRNSKLGPKS